MPGIFRYTQNGDYQSATSADILRFDGSTMASAVEINNPLVVGINGDLNLPPVSMNNVFYYSPGPVSVFSLRDTANANLTPSNAGLYLDISGGAGIATFSGGDFGDHFIGGLSDDSLFGHIGNDTLEGGAGFDTLSGGEDIDTASYEHAGAGVLADLSNAGNNTGDAQGDIYTSIENLRGSSFSDTLTGNLGANMLDGGLGADTMSGRAGADTYSVDNAGDVVDETGGAGELDRIFSSVSVDLSDTSRVTGLVEAVQLLGTGDLEAIGNAVRNYLTGNQGSNVIDGGFGADSMWGRGGNDIYIVDNIGDLVDESIYGGTGIDTVVSSVGFNLGNTGQARGAIENLTLTGGAHINAVGNSLANIIAGNDGANIIAGGLGNDTLTGGDSNDVFFFNTAPGAGNVDTVTDMNEMGNDSIWLDDAVFTALAAGPLAAAAFVISSLGTVDDDDRIVYDSANGELSYDSDGNGGAAGILFAILDSGLDLTAMDFRVV